jgi:hypothetical protein|tara:strand:- start:35 stop:223 length:189 start_codon:yes stop_codon:yes gene_type:complete
MKDYFNLVNTSNYIQNINQGKTGLMKGIYSQKQKIEPLRDASNNFYANETKAQSNYMDRRKI